MWVCSAKPDLFRRSTRSHSLRGAVGLVKSLGEALGFLSGLDEELASWISTNVRWVLPVKSPDPRVHVSFTVNRLTGVIFLSECTPGMGIPGMAQIGRGNRA